MIQFKLARWLFNKNSPKIVMKQLNLSIHLNEIEYLEMLRGLTFWSLIGYADDFLCILKYENKSEESIKN